MMIDKYLKWRVDKACWIFETTCNACCSSARLDGKIYRKEFKRFTYIMSIITLGDVPKLTRSTVNARFRFSGSYILLYASHNPCKWMHVFGWKRRFFLNIHFAGISRGASHPDIFIQESVPYNVVTYCTRFDRYL